ncbi:MAG: CRISPR-associated helicase Cas3', partial [Tannerellaceae bacterium]
YLDTERFMKPEQTALRGRYANLSELKSLFDAHMAHVAANASPSFINEKRAAILSYCREMGTQKPGFFSLTVPTGGGKTLASLAWALNHAILHNKDRIIIVIPYTSIIVQTAAILRAIFGEQNVVEHHSNLEVDGQKESSPSLLATENWDAPIIVTTNVQFFESLYACKVSKCRKLHNICNSVVILDEVQMLPVEFLEPVLDVLQSLQSSFKVSILFTTATMPIFTGWIGSGLETFAGLSSVVTEIIPKDEHLFDDFKRIELHWPTSTTTFEDIAGMLMQHEQVLCVVNTRKDAQELYRRMPKDTLHLSRMMCSVHIMDVIDVIKHKLANHEPVRVVSTQLIEAGVDIDFPVVYRSFAGLDSIIQAAGRCNREGKLNKEGALGQVFVFKLDQNIPPGLMRKSAAALTNLLMESAQSNVFDPAFIERYFAMLYKDCNLLDKANIKCSLYKNYREMNFLYATAAKEFHLIDDKDSVSVLVGYGDGTALLQKLKKNGPEFWLLRKLQRYSVSVKKWDFDKLLKSGVVVEYSGIFILEDCRSYDLKAGLMMDNHWLEELLLV